MGTTYWAQMARDEEAEYWRREEERAYWKAAEEARWRDVEEAYWLELAHLEAVSIYQGANS